MADLVIPSDAFSHSQIKSKLWLAGHFRRWFTEHLRPETRYTLNWYGSWVGMGPFIFLSQSPFLQLRSVRMYDLNGNDLETSRRVLNMWECDSVPVEIHRQDVNEILPDPDPDQIFFNTACEHILSAEWLARIPAGSAVILQSTNMPHAEHINCPADLAHFRSLYAPYLRIDESHQLDFSYPDKSFSRFMLLGVKK